MQHLEGSIEINAPVEEVFAFISDATRAPDWIPGVIEISNIKPTDDGSTYDWVYQMVGIRFAGRSRRFNTRENESFETVSEGAIKSAWKYRLEPRGGATVFHMTIDYSVPAPVAQKIAERMLLRHNQNELNESLRLAKDFVEFQTRQTAAE